jgi:hypothetical protein
MRLVIITFLGALLFTGCMSVDKTIADKVTDVADDYWGDDDVSGVVEKIGQQNDTKLYTYTGIGLFVIGSVLFAIGIARGAGLKLIGCGAVAGAIPYLIQFTYFYYIVAVAGAIVAGMLVWHLWFKIRENETHAEKEKI